MITHRYAAYPDHPLHDVPDAVIDAARAELREAQDWKDVYFPDPELLEPIADAIVIAVLKSLQESGRC